MDNALLREFEQLKVSAFSKYKYLKCGIDQVTLGPSSRRKENHEEHLETELPKITVSKGNQENKESEYQNLLRKNEIQRIKDVRNNLQNHIENMEKFSEHNQMYHRNKWLLAQQEFIRSQQLNEQKILEANAEFDKAVSAEHVKIQKQYQDMEEHRKVCMHELRLAEERKKALHLNIEKIRKNYHEFRMVYQTITGIIQKCMNKEKLKEKLGDNYELLKHLPNQIEELRLKCKNDTINDDVRKSTEILISVQNLSNKLGDIVKELNENKQTNVQKVAVSVNSVPSAVNNQESSNQNLNCEKKTELISNKTISKPEMFSMNKFISKNNFKIYCEIIEFLENHTRSFQELDEDTSLKQFKFDCMKGVNLPVNALSDVNPDHILDKYNRLHSLLQGHNVVITNKTVNISQHPQGIAFCMDLLAKKLVLQGDLMVSSNPESAFCYASLIISLWNEFPSFGYLVLGYFYKSCPSLVPYYVPREADESDEEFYKKCGYQYIEGQIESQDKFLKRITGIARLYFTILIAKPKRGQNKVPHNLCHGWRWLASILKLEPQVDVTATLVHTFLETVGFEMEARYGMLFHKIIEMICGTFLQTCKAKCTGGAGTRLELLLNEYIRKRKFVQPPGYTATSNW